MTELEVLAQIDQLLDLFLQGVSVVFAIVSAYLTALWYFLRAAPFLFRLLAFSFLTLVFSLLGMFIGACYAVYIGVAGSLRGLAARNELTVLEPLYGLIDVQEVAWLPFHVSVAAVVTISSGLAIYAALAYFTFISAIPGRARNF
jgi:hypothetical protein